MTAVPVFLLPACIPEAEELHGCKTFTDFSRTLSPLGIVKPLGISRNILEDTDSVRRYLTIRKICDTVSGVRSNKAACKV